MKIGIALSGGGAFALAHMGVLKALEEQKIRPDLIAGTSMGSVVAALYASGYTPLEMLGILEGFGLDEVTNNPWLHFLGGTVQGGWPKLRLHELRKLPDGLIAGAQLERGFETVLRRKGVRWLRDVAIPLAIPAVDLDSGRTVYFVSSRAGLYEDETCIFRDEVPLAAAVRASVSYPVLFRPRRIAPFRLIDGGISQHVPVDILKRMGADKVLAVLCDGRGKGRFTSEHMLDISGRALELMGRHVADRNLRHADAVLRISGENVGLLDFTKGKKSIQYGYEKTKEALPALMRGLYL